MLPGDDGPDRRADETGSGQAADGWGPPTALAHLCGDSKTDKGYELLKWISDLFI